jgi:hypothetical protein
VIVTITVPVAAVAFAVKVSELVVLAGLGLMEDAITPVGKPEAERVTLPLKPVCGVMVMVLVAWPPCVMLTLLGESESVKEEPELLLELPPQPQRINVKQTAEINSSPSFSRSIRSSFLRNVVHADLKPASRSPRDD